MAFALYLSVKNTKRQQDHTAMRRRQEETHTINRPEPIIQEVEEIVQISRDVEGCPGEGTNLQTCLRYTREPLYEAHVVWSLAIRDRALHRKQQYDLVSVIYSSLGQYHFKHTLVR